MKDFKDVLQDMEQKNIKNLLQELKKQGKLSILAQKEQGIGYLKNLIS